MFTVCPYKKSWVGHTSPIHEINAESHIDIYNDNEKITR